MEIGRFAPYRPEAVGSVIISGIFLRIFQIFPFARTVCMPNSATHHFNGGAIFSSAKGTGPSKEADQAEEEEASTVTMLSEISEEGEIEEAHHYSEQCGIQKRPHVGTHTHPTYRLMCVYMCVCVRKREPLQVDVLLRVATRTSTRVRTSIFIG